MCDLDDSAQTSRPRGHGDVSLHDGSINFQSGRQNLRRTVSSTLSGSVTTAGRVVPILRVHHLRHNTIQYTIR